MTNIRLLKQCFIVLVVVTMSILSLQFCVAKETEYEDHSLSAFIESNPKEQEIKEEITNVLTQNIDKAKKINQRQERKCATGGYYGCEYHLHCTNFYLSQKQLELLQWQYRTASDGDARDDIAQKITSTYVDQIDMARGVASQTKKLWKSGMVEIRDYIDAEILLDRTVREWLNFLSTNQPEKERNDQIPGFLKHNVEKAEDIIKEFQSVDSRLTTPFSRLFADFYLYQKQIELQRWQYENVEDDESRQTAAENLVSTYEKQLGAIQKLVDMSKEWFQQRKMITGTCLHCETLRDRVTFEMMNFKLIKLMEDTGDKVDISDQLAKILQNQQEKARSIYEEYKKQYQEEAKTNAGSRKKTNELGLFQTEYYYQQKQLELLLWQFRNAEEDTVRKEIAEKVMEIYQAQWETAKKLSKIAADFWDAGAITMKDYLDCETMLDQTTFNYLHFTLKNE